MTQSQVQELRYLNGEASSPVARGRGSMSVRNSAPVGGDYPGPRGRGSMMRCVDWRSLGVVKVAFFVFIVSKPTSAQAGWPMGRASSGLENLLLLLLLLYGLDTRYVIHCDSEESQVWESHVSL